MKQTVNIWQLWGFAVTALGGTILHFLYDWLDQAIWVAPFSGVNESTWEHMKLLFWPMLIFSIVQSFFFSEREDFWCIKLRGSLLGLSLIPILFYTYNGVIGISPDPVNIAIFFVSAAAAYAYEAHFLREKTVHLRFPKAALFSLCVIALLFVVFTFITPKIGIFQDPITKSYGI